MNASPDSPDEFEDFEYQLEAAPEVRLCAHCGGRLDDTGECIKCGALMEKLEEINEDVELDEYGMPIGKRREPKGPFTGMLELEEQGEGELPAMFYAVALAVVVIVSFAAILFDAPVGATRWLGILLIVGGGVTLTIAYQRLIKELGPWNEVSKFPVNGMVNMFSPGACDAPPNDPSVSLGKYSVLAMVIGGLALAVSFLLGLVM